MRRSGILMHITSLPGPGGIGTLGPEAYSFADFLHAAGMTIWQVLPCGPTGYGESPYQSASAYAGNPMMISPLRLQEAGYVTLTQEDLQEDADPEHVDFTAVRKRKEALLRRTFEHEKEHVKERNDAFIREHAWAEDYALFMALKHHYQDVQWTKWPDRAVRMREPEALAAAKNELAEEVAYHLFVQTLFFEQWDALREYCHARGILLFGDMPIYVAEDSADTWTNPEVFQLDADRIPRRVAGVPPDYFSEDGQLWGNPLYRWTYLRKVRHFDWWVNRMKGMQRLYDMVRVDHFIGFANYWSVAYGAPNARNGRWVNGPGRYLFDELGRQISGLEIIAEDLGVVSQRVLDLIEYTGFPGMRTLCFGFDGNKNNIHHPRNLKENQVVYTGTHDNDTILSFLQMADKKSLAKMKRQLHFKTVEEGARIFVETCFSTKCNTCIIPMQDVLGLGHDARMNLPGTIGAPNWTWRMKEGAAAPEISAWLRKLNQDSGRITQE